MADYYGNTLNNLDGNIPVMYNGTIPNNYDGNFMAPWPTVSPVHPPNTHWPTTPDSQMHYSPLTVEEQKYHHSTPIVEKKRRGRKSLIPPEERENNRRLKKRDVERKRRAFMLDRMNALQDVTLSIIGQQANGNQKLEKAELLTLCHGIMQTVSNVMEDNPSLSKVLRTEIDKQQLLQQTKLDTFNNTPAEDHATTDEGIVDVESTIESNDDKENVIPAERISAFQPYRSNSTTGSHLTDTRQDSMSWSSIQHTSSNESSVWRPYL